jgi:small subunit ribosomal protein S6
LKQKYETVVIFDGTLPDETIQKESAKMEEFLKANAEFEKVDVWGKKTLAYTIRKKKTGYYCVYYYDTQSEANIAGKIEKFFKLNDNVIRHLTVIRLIQKIVERRLPGAEAPAPVIEEGAIANDE